MFLFIEMTMIWLSAYATFWRSWSGACESRLRYACCKTPLPEWPGSTMGVSGMLNCSGSQLLIPTCCTWAISALFGPKAACSRNRAALRLAVPRPVPGLGGPAIFTVAVPVDDGLATLAARIVTVAGLGGVPGAA